MPLVDVSKVERLIKNRIQARHAQDWAEVDRIREELDKIGIVLVEDYKTGHVEWRVKSTEKI